MLVRVFSKPFAGNAFLILCVFAVILMGVTIARDAGVFLTFGAFIAAIWLPLTFHIVRLLPRDAGATSFRISIASCLAIVGIAGLFVIRKYAGGYGFAFDGAIACWLLVSLAKYKEDLRHCLQVLLTMPSGVFAVACSFLVCTTQFGFANPTGDEVNFTGLHVVDFGNLTSITGLVKIADGLPMGPIAGDSSIRYHWLYFAFPAWASQFLGADLPSDRILALTNCVTAWVALMVLYTAARVFSRTRHRSLIAFLVLLFVVMLPMSNHVIDNCLRLAGVDFRGAQPRNHLILPPLNSLAVFGNNTLACGSALLSVVLARKLVAGHGLMLHGLTALLAALTILLSITLFFSLALGLVAWYLRNRGWPRPTVLMALALPPLAVIFFASKVGMLASGNGGPSISLQFDNFQWCFTLLTAILPIMAALAVYWKMEFWRHPEFFAIIGCVIVPSFMFVSSSGSVGADFSMKTGTLICFLSVSALVCVFENANRYTTSRKLSLVLLALLGAFHSAAYLSLFPLSTLGYFPNRIQTMPLGKYECLRFVRSNTARSSIVLDKTKPSFDNANEVTFIAERISSTESPYEQNIRGERTSMHRADVKKTGDGLNADVWLTYKTETPEGFQLAFTSKEFKVWIRRSASRH